MNGFEFARSISRIEPEIKVLLMTAFDYDDTLVNMNMKYRSINFRNRGINKDIGDDPLFPFGNLSHTLSSITLCYAS
jgi:hypothetical protein